MELMRQKQFLKDQGKTKKAEEAWFKRLEDELDRIDTDERMLREYQEFKLKQIEEKKQEEQKAIAAKTEEGEDEQKLDETDLKGTEWEGDSPLPDAKFDEAITPARLLKDEKEPTNLSPTEKRVSTAAHEKALTYTDDNSD